MTQSFGTYLKFHFCFLKADRSLAGKGSAGMYGMMARIPDQSVVDDFILEFFNQVYKL